MTIDQAKALTKGAAFTFNLSGQEPVKLTVESNDGETLVGNVIAGPKDGQRMVWSLSGLDHIDGIS